MAAVVLAMGLTTALAHQPPATIARQIDAQLKRCVQTLRCDVSACATGGGLKSCYNAVTQVWEQKLARIDETLSLRGGWCAAHWAGLQEAYAGFSEKAMQSRTWANSPYNTDDDFILLTLQQRYEMAYAVLNNYECKGKKAP
ncbi:hypothetical protein os4_11080 [Comamonadaceae bacterium OS-4]|nr:hypothetical protein os4_11080 [Comamonadaceae bacterium OS-4]